MIVVSDTTPLISLMKIGRLGLAEQLFRYFKDVWQTYQRQTLQAVA